ncbi:hypothetical protein AOLI_G00014200 [Acnodon oligacanthus]
MKDIRSHSSSLGNSVTALRFLSLLKTNTAQTLKEQLQSFRHSAPPISANGAADITSPCTVNKHHKIINYSYYGASFTGELKGSERERERERAELHAGWIYRWRAQIFGDLCIFSLTQSWIAVLFVSSRNVLLSLGGIKEKCPMVSRPQSVPPGDLSVLS